MYFNFNTLPLKNNFKTNVMKANELRIGNSTKQGEVKNFWEKGVHVGFGKCYEFNELKPIPLTEEWLLKFGFVTPYEKDYFVLYLSNNEYLFYNPNGSGLNLDDGFGANNCIKINFLFVHQLQNLYFALTNEELTIKTK